METVEEEVITQKERNQTFHRTHYELSAVPADADIDADDLPDYWELASFGNISQIRAGDYDSDGHSNFAEYNLETNAADGNDAPDPDDYDEGVDFGLAATEQQGGGGLVGETVRILNGNVIEIRNDLQFDSPHSIGLSFQAFYNSRSARVGDLGYGWTHSYAVVLETGFGTGSGGLIRIYDETGQVRYFLLNASGIYEGYFNERTRVTVESGDYIWHRLDGSRYGFSSAGKLIWIDDEKGNVLALAYDAQGKLETVTDAYGTVRSYTLGEINGQKRVTAMTGLAAAPYDGGKLVRWQYDALMNLTEVETAGATIHQYQNHDARGNPATVILADSEPEERTISYTFHPDMNVALTRSEPSVLGAGNKITTWDYDDDYDTTANENPTHLLSRIIEQGFTKDVTGATVASNMSPP